jgi:hypothetical protein
VLLLLKHGVENHAPILKLAVGSNLLPISQQEIFGEADGTSSSTDNYVLFQVIIHDAKLGVGFCWQNPKRSIFYMAFRLFYFCVGSVTCMDGAVPVMFLSTERTNPAEPPVCTAGSLSSCAPPRSEPSTRCLEYVLYTPWCTDVGGRAL